MPNKTATHTRKISYLNELDVSTSVPTVTTSAPYQASSINEIDVLDAATSGTEYAIPFGSVEAATVLDIENQTGQDVQVRINGAPASVTGTLVSGTKTIALASVTGEHLSVERVTSAGTPGILSVRRSGGNMIVESWLAGTGIQALDLSDIKVWQGGSPNLFRLPDGGLLSIALPDAAGASPIASASVLLTATQSGAGKVFSKVFGDPV